jgi:hypothetical protein
MLPDRGAGEVSALALGQEHILIWGYRLAPLAQGHREAAMAHNAGHMIPGRGQGRLFGRGHGRGQSAGSSFSLNAASLEFHARQGIHRMREVRACEVQAEARLRRGLVAANHLKGSREVFPARLRARFLHSRPPGPI